MTDLQEQINTLTGWVRGMDWGVLIAAPLLTLAAIIMGVLAAAFWVLGKPIEKALLWESRH